MQLFSWHPRSNIRTWGPRTWGLLLVFVATLTLPGSAKADNAATAPLCRFGVNVHLGTGIDSISDFDVAQLRVGRYIDYRARANPNPPTGMRYIPVINLSQVGNSYSASPSGTALEEMILGNAGAPIYIGNEPDRRIFQDDVEPQIYARAYHELYTTIKTVDPSMQVLPASIVQATELRLKYLDLALEAYEEQYGKPMPVDGWSIHGFILNEKAGEWGADIPPGLTDREGMVIDVQQTDDIDIFIANIERFRRWMAANGYHDQPLYLSEYGSLMPDLDYLCGPRGDQCFTADRVNDYMTATFDYLLTATDPVYGYPADDFRLVQHFSWYSTNDKQFNGFLFDEDNGNALSTMGANYAAYTAAIDNEIDFRIVDLSMTPVAPPFNGGAVDFTIRAEISNSGNLQQVHQAAVTFYHGNPDDDGVPLGPPQTVELSGCGDRTFASITWQDIDNRFNGDQIYVTVTPAGVTDADTANNTLSQPVFFAKAYVYLPQID